MTAKKASPVVAKTAAPAAKTAAPAAKPATPAAKPAAPAAKTAAPAAKPATPAAKTAAISTPPPLPAQKQHKNNSWIVPTVLLILALAAIGYLLLRNSKPAIANGSNTESTTVLPSGSSDPTGEAPAVAATEAPAAWDSFPETVTYTITMYFKDGTELSKTLSTDLDLEDDKQTWDRIQKVGIKDLVVVSSTSPLIFFYNGYAFPVAPGENKSLGEIWEKSMSNDIEYTAGFSFRQLGNGCTQLSSEWIDDAGVTHVQAQTAINQIFGEWLLDNCDDDEVAEWLLHRSQLGMPDTVWTK